ncbi:MAG: hypothetical protein EB102_09740, partial [Gammaproteobacteria bacterium]|nr:hypothetical protein [Gammaproteobacteria bacterium]
MVGASGDVELVVGHHQRVDDDARTRGDKHVSAIIGGNHRTAEPDVAIAGQDNAAIPAGAGLAPDRRRTAELGRRIGSDGTG